MTQSGRTDDDRARIGMRALRGVGTVPRPAWREISAVPRPAWHEVGAVPRPAWRDAYVRRIVASDAGCAALAAGAGHATPFGPGTEGATPPLPWLAVLLPVVWVFTMFVARTYEHRFLWHGFDEFRRIFLGTAVLLAVTATGSWAVGLEAAREVVVVSLPLAACATLVERAAWRAQLRRRQRLSTFQQRTLLVGYPTAVEALHAQIARKPEAGREVIGACLPMGRGAQAPAGDSLRVLGGFDDVAGVVRRYEVDTVALIPSVEWDRAAVDRLGWALEETSTELLLAPSMTETIGPRVQIRPMCGLPLVHVAPPELSGVRRLAKDVLDRCAATAGVLFLAPVLLGIALAIKATSEGPVLYRQTRVGRDGETFSMLKFRTMVTDADQMIETLAQRNDGNGVLFKLRRDPRVTPVGRVLRRSSLDELPQLFNVIRGEMSLVGPRPPLPAEVSHYGSAMHRRFLVKPGLTGLWQISGRSDLSWEESVRIDLLYVENWSLSFDLLIMWRTLGAVLRGEGAY
jgi:exopolysaccharide biosynthesis polyprenyl glycosylphosphotransferase